MLQYKFKIILIVMLSLSLKLRRAKSSCNRATYGPELKAWKKS